MPKFEETYNHTLRSIELTLVRQYRQYDNLSDWETLAAVNGLLRTYTAESRRRQPPRLKLDPLAQQVFNRLQTTCEGWLGRKPLIDETGSVTTLTENVLSINEIIACLKRIRKSIEMWQKKGGRRGYFEFIDQFLP